MNGEKFYLNLKEEILAFFEEYHTDHYRKSKEWTHVMTKKVKKRKNGQEYKYPKLDEVIIDKVLKSIYGESVGLSVGLSKEYYRIDNTAWEYTESKSGYRIGYQQNYKHNINAHRWKLLAAVEHENKSEDWTDELVKLAYINCPLRVVISYGDCTDNYKKAIEVANEIATDIELDKFVNTENQEFLLIFGPKKENIRNIEDPKEIVSKFMCFKWNGISFSNKMSVKEYISIKKDTLYCLDELLDRYPRSFDECRIDIPQRLSSNCICKLGDEQYLLGKLKLLSGIICFLSEKKSERFISYETSSSTFDFFTTMHFMLNYFDGDMQKFEKWIDENEESINFITEHECLFNNYSLLRTIDKKSISLIKEKLLECNYSYEYVELLEIILQIIQDAITLFNLDINQDIEDIEFNFEVSKSLISLAVNELNMKKMREMISK